MIVTTGLGTSVGYFYWYGMYTRLYPFNVQCTSYLQRLYFTDVCLAHGCSGYHMAAVRRRDFFYAKLEDDRVEGAGV